MKTSSSAIFNYYETYHKSKNIIVVFTLPIMLTFIKNKYKVIENLYDIKKVNIVCLPSGEIIKIGYGKFNNLSSIGLIRWDKTLQIHNMDDQKRHWLKH